MIRMKIYKYIKLAQLNKRLIENCKCDLPFGGVIASLAE